MEVFCHKYYLANFSLNTAINNNDNDIIYTKNQAVPLCIQAENCDKKPFGEIWSSLNQFLLVTKAQLLPKRIIDHVYAKEMFY